VSAILGRTGARVFFVALGADVIGLGIFIVEDGLRQA